MNPTNKPKISLETIRTSNESVQFKTELLRVPARKPNKQEFFRVREGAEFTTRVLLLSREDDGDYLVAPELKLILGSVLKEIDLFVAVDRNNNPFLLQAGVIDKNRPNSWHVSRHRSIKESHTRWVRTCPNQFSKSYDITFAVADFGEPKWPEESLEDLINLAFGDRYISSEDHPIAQQILGLA